MVDRASRRRFALGAITAFTSIATVRGRARAAQFTYKYGNSSPVSFARSVRAVQMAAAIRQETEGRLEIQVFPNSQLGGDSAMLSQLRLGGIQFFCVDSATLASFVPVAAITGVGFAFRKDADAYAAFDGDLGAYVRSEIEAKGIHPFERMWSNGFRQITSSSHPIRTVDDLSNFKIRTPSGPLLVDIFRTLGASPTPLDAAETYTALQTKIVDGQENSYVIINDFRFFEVQKYLSVTNHMWSAAWFLANVDAMHALPPDIAAIVTRNVNKYALLDRRDNLLLNVSVSDMLRREGLAFNVAETESFHQRLSGAGFYGKWKAVFGPRAWSLLERYSGRLA